jgi:hypothetical protein
MKKLLTADHWLVLQTRAIAEDYRGRAKVVGLREILAIQALYEIASGEVGPINARTHAMSAIVHWLGKQKDKFLLDIRDQLKAELETEHAAKRQQQGAQASRRAAQAVWKRKRQRHPIKSMPERPLTKAK